MGTGRYTWAGGGGGRSGLRAGRDRGEEERHREGGLDGHRRWGGRAKAPRGSTAPEPRGPSTHGCGVRRGLRAGRCGDHRGGGSGRGGDKRRGRGRGGAAHHPGRGAVRRPRQTAGSGTHVVTWALWLRKMRMENVRALHSSADCAPRAAGVWVLGRGGPCLVSFAVAATVRQHLPFTTLRCCGSGLCTLPLAFIRAGTLRRKVRTVLWS